MRMLHAHVHAVACVDALLCPGEIEDEIDNLDNPCKRERPVTIKKGLAKSLGFVASRAGIHPNALAG